LALSPDPSDEAIMRLLSLIKELNAHGIYPTYHELLEQFCNSDAFMSYAISDHRERGNLEEISTLDNGYNVVHYKIIDNGGYSLDKYLSKVRFFISTLQELCANGTVDDLYKYIEENRDCFGSHTIRKCLQMLISRKLKNGWISIARGSYLLKAGTRLEYECYPYSPKQALVF
jgi:hypothetical protein